MNLFKIVLDFFNKEETELERFANKNIDFEMRFLKEETARLKRLNDEAEAKIKEELYQEYKINRGKIENK